MYTEKNKMETKQLLKFFFTQDAYEKQIKEKAKAGELRVVNGGDAQKQAAAAAAEKKKRRWDQAAEDSGGKKAKTTWESAETPSNTRWDETPGRKTGAETPGATPGQSTRMWDATPGHLTPGATTPGRDTGTPGHQASSARRNRWDETPRTERGKAKYSEGCVTVSINYYWSQRNHKNSW